LRSAGKTHEEMLSDMRWVLIRDVGLLLLTAQVLSATAPRAVSRWTAGR
jgi:hypothetical protein